MTTPQSPSQLTRFQGTQSALANSALDDVLKHSSGGKKLLGNALRIQEGDHGFSVVTFIQNNLVALLPKWVVSRSPIETTEFSFLEIAESSLLYFALPFFGNKLVQPFFTKIAQKEFKNAAEEAAVKTGIRAATIMSTVGVTLVGGEFITHYVKNLITAKVFKKDRFSDVVNLSHGQIKSTEHSDVVEKCEKRIKQCLAGCAGIIGASLLLAKNPTKLGLITKASEGLVKHLNFAEGKNGKLCLGKNQMRLYMALAVFAYMDSARDKLEKVETASRLAVILPYLAVGQQLLEKGMLKFLPDYLSPILNKSGKKVNVKSLSDLAKLAKSNAKTSEEAATVFADSLKRKAVYTGVPLAVGIFGTGIGVGLLNRFWTKYRYQKQMAEQQAPAARATVCPALNTLSQSMPLPAIGAASSFPNTAMPFPTQFPPYSMNPPISASTPFAQVAQNQPLTGYGQPSPLNSIRPTGSYTRIYTP